MQQLDLAAQRYGTSPSELLKRDPGAFAIDVGIAMRADALDLRDRTGRWWWIRIFEALGLMKGAHDDQSYAGGVNWL